MTERIKKLTELTLSGQMYVNTVKTVYDEADLRLPRQQMESKRICEYMLHQEPKLTEYSCLTGFFNIVDNPTDPLVQYLGIVCGGVLPFHGGKIVNGL